MTRRLPLSSLAVISLMVSLSVAVAARSPTQAPGEIKVRIARLNARANATAIVTLTNGVTLKGRVASAGSEYFLLQDLESPTSTVVAYRDVVRVEGQGENARANALAVVALASGGALLALLLGLRLRNEARLTAPNPQPSYRVSDHGANGRVSP
jgi:hypothetical protein